MSPAFWLGTLHVMMVAPKLPTILLNGELLIVRSGTDCPPLWSRPHTKLPVWSSSRTTSSEYLLKTSLVLVQLLNTHQSLPNTPLVGYLTSNIWETEISISSFLLCKDSYTVVFFLFVWIEMSDAALRWKNSLIVQFFIRSCERFLFLLILS